MHPDSQYTGDQLMKQTVSYEKLKLTNNILDKNNQVNKMVPIYLRIECIYCRFVGV
jgi:T-box protein 20